MRELRTNTATRITVGPFLDKTDGITPEIALTVTSELLTFVVDDAGVPTLVLDVAPTASGGANDMVHITSDSAGYYDLELAAANVNYLGRALLSLNDVATHLPVFHEFMIITQAEYDRKYSTGASVADVKTVVDDIHTDVADVHTDIGTHETAQATNRAVVNNIHDTDLSAVKTDTAALITQVGDVHATDLPAVMTMLTDIHGTDLPAVKTDTAAILVDTAVIGALGAGLTAVPWNASWDAEVQSEVFDALDAAFADATGLTANGLLDRIRTLGWILRNKIEVTDANGNTVIYKDDSTTAAFTVNAMLTDNSTTTTRLRAV